LKGQKIEELFNIDLGNKNPIYRQIYQSVVGQIINKQLKVGGRLPASRQLAKQLQISRNTVQRAYDQLLVEGYIASKPGSGMYIQAEVPDDYCQSFKGKAIVAGQVDRLPVQTCKESFAPGIPDLNNFPHKQWGRMTNKVMREKYQALLHYNHYEGDAGLRKTLVDYLSYARGVVCVPEQIIITSGAQEAINLALRVMLSAKKTIAMENPGYIGAYEALDTILAKVLPIPVLDNGLDIGYLMQQKRSIDLCYITPSHQYPLGSTLSINQRLALLQWANKKNCYLIEDDYDSEYHYKAKPLPSLQGLDKYERVIYMGTFSKVLFPALRLGFVVVPPKLLPAFKKMKRFGFGATPLFNQFVLNEFMQAGYLNKHIKSMRIIYAKKHALLTKLCFQLLPDSIEVLANDIGLHITLIFPKKSDEKNVIGYLNANGFYPSPLSKYYPGSQKKYGLVIGFANTSLKYIEIGIQFIHQYFLDNT
jgi:GntR family transcriptional regulator/MocR family aminotransferase